MSQVFPKTIIWLWYSSQSSPQTCLGIYPLFAEISILPFLQAPGTFSWSSKRTSQRNMILLSLKMIDCQGLQLFNSIQVSVVTGKRPIPDFVQKLGWIRELLTLFRSFNCFFLILQKIFSIVMRPETTHVSEHAGYGAPLPTTQ